MRSDEELSCLTDYDGRVRRDEALLCLYRASAALDQARSATTDTYLNARIREIAVDVLNVIGKLATAANEARTSQ